MGRDGVYFCLRVCLQIGRIAKEGYHIVETRKRVASKFGEGLTGAFYAAGRIIKMALGEELVGIADDFFLEALGQQVAWRHDGQVLGYNLGSGDACARVALTHASMAIQAHAIEHAAPQDTVQDIGFGAVTVDAGGIGSTHADVVKHGSLFNKLDVDGHMPVDETLGERHCQVGDVAAMMNQHPVIIITGCVVSLDD